MMKQKPRDLVCPTKYQSCPFVFLSCGTILFLYVSSACSAKAMMCLHGDSTRGPNTVTHVNNKPKRMVEVVWYMESTKPRYPFQFR